jgi:hypothetical protein
MVNNIERDEYIKLKKYLENITVQTNSELPLYDVLFKNIVLPYSNGALIRNILLYEKLREQISNTEVQKVKINISEDKYHPVICDLINSLDCSFEYTNRYNKVNNSILSKLRLINIRRFLLSIVGQLYFLILTALRGHVDDNLEEIESVVIPYPGRDESLQPVIEEMSSTTLALLDTRSILTNITGYSYPTEWTECRSKPFHSSSSVRQIYAQLRLISQVYFEFLIRQNIKRELRAEIKNTRGIVVDNILEHAVNNGFEGEIMNFSRAAILNHMLSESDSIQRIITGSNGSMYQSIRFFAEMNNIDDYYIPHTIAHPVEGSYLPITGSNMILSGEFDKNVLESNYKKEQLPELYPLGRPYFRKRLDVSSTENDETTESMKITILTQKLKDIRRKFVIDLLNELNQIKENDIKIIIKIHPAEKRSYYQQLVSTLETQSEHVKIADNNLSYHLRSSDLTFTINSNTGLESMIVGTMSVSYNTNIPVIPSMPYITEGPGTLLTDRNELSNFVQGINNSDVNIEEQSKNCESFAKENYYPSHDSAKNIATMIEDGSPVSD